MTIWSNNYCCNYRVIKVSVLEKCLHVFIYCRVAEELLARIY